MQKGLTGLDALDAHKDKSMEGKEILHVGPVFNVHGFIGSGASWRYVKKKA